MEPLPLPFALSLSFDRLSANGVLIILSLSKDQLSPISALQHTRH
jgi:hypothetical protein